MEETLDFTLDDEDSVDLGDISDDMSDDDILAFMDSVFDGDDLFVPDKDVSFTPDDPDAVPSFYTQPDVDVEETAVEPPLEETLDFIADADESSDLGDISDDMSDDDILAFMDSVLGSEDSFVPEKDVSFTPDDPDAVPSFYTQPDVDVEETAVEPPLEEETPDLASDTDDSVDLDSNVRRYI